MNTPDVSHKPEPDTGSLFGAALAAAWPFGLFAALWAGLLGVILGWGESFVTGDGFWQITLIMTSCAFLGGTLAYMIFAGQKGLIRATLAGVLTPFLAVLLGAAVIAWGALPHIALTGLAFVALPLCLPSAILALVYRAAHTRIRRQRNNG